MQKFPVPQHPLLKQTYPVGQSAVVVQLTKEQNGVAQTFVPSVVFTQEHAPPAQSPAQVPVTPAQVA